MISDSKKKNIATLTICTLAMIIATACGSSTGEPAIGSATSDESVPSKVMLSKAARDARCPSEVQGFDITLADTMINADTLKRVGGVCVFGEAAYQTLHSHFQMGFGEQQYCYKAQEYADSLGGGDYERASRKVTEHLEHNIVPTDVARNMLFLFSTCSSDKVGSTSARIYSVGTYTKSGKTCDGILWSHDIKDIEHHYRLTGLNGCTLPSPPSGMYNPEIGAEGRLLGNYFREDLGYTGDIPKHFRHKGKNYPFYTPKPILTRPDKDEVINVTEISSSKQSVDVESTYGLSVEGNWACSTANPDGSVSRDVYDFSSDGRLLSSSNGVEVRGRFSELDGDLELHFTSVKRSVKTKKVDVRTNGKVIKRTERTLDFITFDAKTQEKRQVSCINQGSAADHEIAEASLPNSYRERLGSVVVKQSDTVQPRIQAAQPVQDFSESEQSAAHSSCKKEFSKPSNRQMVAVNGFDFLVDMCVESLLR